MTGDFGKQQGKSRLPPRTLGGYEHIWSVFLAGSCFMLLLMLVPGLTAVRRTERVYREIRQIQQISERKQRLIDELGRNLAAASIVMREFLLDTDPGNDRRYLTRMLSTREELGRQLVELRGMLAGRETGAFERLQEELNRYWSSVLPIFRWTVQQKREQATYFLRQEQRPRRESILATTNEISRLNEAFYQQQYESINSSERALRGDLDRVIKFAFLGGIAVCAISLLRIRSLERRAREEHVRVERAHEELRRLSALLRQLQEEERKSISRELHDEVGQKLTALRMEAGGLERLRAAGDEQFGQCVGEIKSLAEQSLRTIRDLAAALRPSALDDLGLGPALQRHARDIARRTGLRINVEIAGDMQALPERHRVYVYRIVQEALNNCVKHSKAKNVHIELRNERDAWSVLVSDDGAGFDPSRTSRGLGLIGMEERARELGGTLVVRSQPGQGARLEATIPKGKVYEEHSSAAG